MAGPLEYGPDPGEDPLAPFPLAKLGLQPETKLRQIGADCHAHDHLSHTTVRGALPRPKMAAYAASGIAEMAWDDFLKVVDFYERSGMHHMALLGGEPTRHSRLLEILACLESRNFSIQIGTNGIVPSSLVDALSERCFSQLFFFLNSTSYFDYERTEEAGSTIS